MKPFGDFLPGSIWLDNLKVKKTVKFFPLQLTATGIFNLHSKAFSHKLTCKDVVIKGKVTYSPETRSLEYRKRFPVPVIGAKFGCLVATARWSFYDGIQLQTWRPDFRLGFEFRNKGAEVVKFNSVRLKPHLYYKNIGLEARTQLTLQVPSQLFFDLNGGDALAGDGDDTFGVSLDVQELNLVLRL